MITGGHHSATLHHGSPSAHTAPAAHAQTAALTVPGSYTVRPGDTLSQLAARFYGHADRWPALWWSNRHSVHNPDSITVGQQLSLASWHPASPVLLARALRHVPQPAPPRQAVLASTAAGAADPAPAAPADPPPAASAPVAASSGYQACVIAHESGGNPLAINPSSGASGLYGFLDSTWQSVTGLGGAARDYSPATQTQAFWKLYGEAGRSPWITDGC
jgi:hypothetical protein